MARGETDAAREWADAALAAKQPDSAVNLFRAERLALARDWAEFLRFAPRKPIALAYGGDIPDDVTSVRPATAFDLDSAGPLNRTVPLERWIEAANSTALPRPLAAEIAQAGWIRAVLLDDAASARTLAARARELRPELAAAVRDYQAQTDPEAAKFTAQFWMLRLPGLAPEVRAGIGRTTKVDAIDSFRDNWWWRAPAPANPAGRDSSHQPLYDLYPSGDLGPTAFLPPAELAAGGKEAKQLNESASNAVIYLCTAAMARARTHPQDPRVPEALALAVRATRYGGGADKTTSPLSKQVFDLLHRNYPNSEWAEKTKYWY
jgi:hypothetical protein